MKNKIIIALVLLGVLMITGSVSAFVYQRWTYSDQYQIIATQEQQENASVTLTLPALTAATSSVLVDLSNTMFFPHYNTGSIFLSRINVSWVSEGLSASTTLKFGVVASTTPSGSLADVYYFDTVSFYAGNGSYQRKNLEYTPSLVKLSLNGATTTGFTSNDKLLATSNYATTTKLTSPRGSYATNPGVGDLVMTVYDQRGTASTTVQAFYHVK